MSRRPERVPPHDLEAEKSVLGAALVSPDAAEIVAAIPAGDFYPPAHQHVAAAVAELVAGAEPVDVVTVAAQLRRGEVLELAGGTEYLVELQAVTPSLGRATAYARLVREAAARRRLIITGGEIAELGYIGHEEPAGALARAQELLAGVAVVPSSGWRIFADPAGVDDDGDPPAPTLLRRCDGAFLLYEGRENSLQGEPASGKTWVALIAAAEALAAGRTVVAVDLEDTARAARTRLRLLGATGEQLARFLHTDARDVDTGHELSLAELAPTVAAASPDLVVVDSVSEAFSRWQLDEDKADDVNHFRDALVKPLTRNGITVVTLDHVAKSAEQRGRYARGSGAKLSGLDGAAYSVTTSGFNRTTGGRIYLKVAKDRHGALPGVVGDTIAQVWMPPTGEGHSIRFAVEVPPPPAEKADKAAARTAADHQLHDELRAAALDAITKATTPLSRRSILAEIRTSRHHDKRSGFDDKKLDAPLADLVAAGEIATIPGKGGHPTYALPPQQQTLLGDPDDTRSMAPR